MIYGKAFVWSLYAKLQTLVRYFPADSVQMLHAHRLCYDYLISYKVPHDERQLITWTALTGSMCHVQGSGGSKIKMVRDVPSSRLFHSYFLLHVDYVFTKTWHPQHAHEKNVHEYICLTGNWFVYYLKITTCVPDLPFFTSREPVSVYIWRLPNTLRSILIQV